MYSEKTEIVDVVAITENNSTTYSLSKKAGDLFEAAKAGTVIRRHDVNETGNPDYKDYAYVGLSEVKLNGSGYTFKFASGDEFTASDADAYPSASSISDAIAGGGSGGGGGALVVHMDENSTLDKTWNEINAADVAVIVYSKIEDGKTYHMRELVVGTALINGNYLVRADGGESDNAMYKTDSADGYPVNPVLQQ